MRCAWQTRLRSFAPTGRPSRVLRSGSRMERVVPFMSTDDATAVRLSRFTKAILGSTSSSLDRGDDHDGVSSLLKSPTNGSKRRRSSDFSRYGGPSECVNYPSTSVATVHLVYITMWMMNTRRTSSGDNGAWRSKLRDSSMDYHSDVPGTPHLG